MVPRNFIEVRCDIPSNPVHSRGRSASSMWHHGVFMLALLDILIRQLHDKLWICKGFLYFSLLCCRLLRFGLQMVCTFNLLSLLLLLSLSSGGGGGATVNCRHNL